MLQIGGVLFECWKFGIEVIEDVFGVEVSEWRRVIFFIVIGGSHRRGAGSSELVGVFHSCCLCLFEGDGFFSKQDDVFFYKSLEWQWHESDFVQVPRSCPQWDFDEVNVASSLSFVHDYCFHFIFVFSFDKIRWRTWIVGSVDIIFVIWQ